MESSRDRTCRATRKITSPERRCEDIFTSLTNQRECTMPRRSAKQPKTIKTNESNKHFVYQNKSYLIKKASHGKVPALLPNDTSCGSPKNSALMSKFNRTAFGSPIDKSAMYSYIATPNERSTPNLLHRVTTRKQQFQSTQDQNYSQSTLKVNFVFQGKRIFSKAFADCSKIKEIGEQFVAELSNEIKGNYYGLAGFEVVPFNSVVACMLSKRDLSVQELIEEGYRELTLSPLLLEVPISYDRLEVNGFEIVRFLGSGGFSQVYLARCKLDQQYCALKFIRKQTITSAKKVKMLQNQKNILFQVRHANLIDLYYAFQSRNYIVFGLQYCPNGSLYSFLQRAKCIKQSQARFIFKQILCGLQYLHGNNILFRDIKLENILFDKNGNIKITDFGLSKPEIEEDDVTYSYCGSPEYMAPQMLTKSGHSLQVDYYALGILLYELLFGRSPFYATKKEDIFLAILNSEPKFPKSPAVSKEVKALIRGLLTKNPNHRIGSLKGVTQILHHPWLRSTDFDTSIPASSFVVPATTGQNKQLTHFKEMFAAEKLSQQFEKVFFGQSFVNRNLLQSVEDSTIKFIYLESKIKPKMKNNFIKHKRKDHKLQSTQ